MFSGTQTLKSSRVSPELPAISIVSLHFEHVSLEQVQARDHLRHGNNLLVRYRRHRRRPFHASRESTINSELVPVFHVDNDRVIASIFGRAARVAMRAEQIFIDTLLGQVVASVFVSLSITVAVMTFVVRLVSGP